MQKSDAKTLAIPAPGRQPDFDQVADMLLTAALCEVPVCVMCLTQETLNRWLQRTETESASLTLLDTLDTNRATLSDWQQFLKDQTCEVVLLHGAKSELQAGRLSVGYVRALVNAVPAGLVMLV